MSNYFAIFLFTIFLAGIVVILTFNTNVDKIHVFERFENDAAEATPGATPQATQGETPETKSTCPDMLIQNGTFLFLYNSKAPVVNGSNPIVFNNLDEYISYHDTQKQNGTDCPLLYLVKENNSQGEDVYRIRPSPFDLQGGLLPVATYASVPILTGKAPAVAPQFNSNLYHGFDPQDQDVGYYGELDKIHDSTKQQPISDNPMDPNWGGREYTRQVVDSGKYDDYNISRPQLFNVKSVMFDPNVANSFGPPKDIY